MANGGLQATSQAIVLDRGGLGAYATAMAGPGPVRRLDQEDLAAWVRTRMSPIQGKYQCNHFYLQHDAETAEGRDRPTITSVNVPEAKGKGKKLTEEEEDEFVLSLCEEFDRASWTHAATYPRMQRFFVGAVIVPPDTDPDEEREIHAIAEYPFLVSPPPENAAEFSQEGGGDLNVRGVLSDAQEIAHNASKLLASNMQLMMDRMLTREQMLIEHNERMMERAFTEARLKEELLDARALREVQVKREELDMELKQKLWLRLADFGIMLGTKVVRAKWGPTGAQIDSKILQSMMGLDPKHLVDVIGVVNKLPEAQRQKFGPVFEMVLEGFDDAKRAEVYALLMATSDAAEFKEEQKKGVEFRPGANSDSPTGAPSKNGGSK